MNRKIDPMYTLQTTCVENYFFSLTSRNKYRDTRGRWLGYPGHLSNFLWLLALQDGLWAGGVRASQGHGQAMQNIPTPKHYKVFGSPIKFILQFKLQILLLGFGVQIFESQSMWKGIWIQGYNQVPDHEGMITCGVPSLHDLNLSALKHAILSLFGNVACPATLNMLHGMTTTPMATACKSKVQQAFMALPCERRAGKVYIFKCEWICEDHIIR